jgi:hypothetical protein
MNITTTAIHASTLGMVKLYHSKLFVKSSSGKRNRKLPHSPRKLLGFAPRLLRLAWTAGDVDAALHCRGQGLVPSLELPTAKR